ncbi:hypothetical protein BDV93DRAFT_605802 [Ceratobasidium sp. AG-I]|nr:hypothetical protein BDV93DRAFT_605802 [Ceratobasidium sp. AG-I]
MSTWSRDTPLKEITFSKRGFTLEHAGFLHRKIFQQRRVLTAARVLYPARFRGWSILFYMLLVRLREKGHFGCSDFPSDHDCPRRTFQDLISRFWLAKSPPEEEVLVSKIHWSIYKLMGRRGVELEGSKQFEKESPFLCKAYALRVLPTAGAEPFDIQSSSSLFQWIAFCFQHQTLCVMPAVFKASLLRISEGFQDENQVTWSLTEFAGLIFGFASTILVYGRVPAHLVINISEVFLETDLVDLIGKILLRAADDTHSKLKYAFLDDDEASLSNYWDETRYRLRDFIAALIECYSPSRSLLLNSHPDWIKTGRYIQNAIYAHKHNSDLRRHLIECREEWLWLGEQLEIEDHCTDGLEMYAFCENEPELVVPWPLTRESLLTDSVVDNPSNVAILSYFEALSSKSVVPYNSPSGSVLEARKILQELTQQDTMPTSALERLLSLALQPDYLYEFTDSRIVPACMKLLELYCLENELFSGAYGYLCIQILVIGLQVDVLIKNKELEEFIRSQRSMPSCNQLLALSERAADLLRSNLSTWPAGRSIAEINIAGRGFTVERAGFFYRQLSEQRRVFTAARVLYPERFHGWSALFYMVLVLTRKSGHLGCPGLPPDHDCPRRALQDLIIRFRLVESAPVEESLLDDMYWIIQEPIGKRGIESQKSISFDEEAVFLCKAYTLRILPTASSEPLVMQSSASLFQWTAFCFGYHNLSAMPVVFKASLLRILEGCQNNSGDVRALTNFTWYIFAFANSILLNKTVPAYHAMHIAEVFTGVGLVGLFGSFLLSATKATNSELEYPFLPTTQPPPGASKTIGLLQRRQGSSSMDSQEFFEHFPEPTLPWPITRDSLLTDGVIGSQSNAAILQYFETLASGSVVLYRAPSGCESPVHEILDQLVRRDVVPVATLEQLLSLALHPSNLCHFDDERIIPACMKLLENYCSSNRLLGGAYGYLCIRILVVAFQVSVLSQHDEFDYFLDLCYLRPPHNRLLALSEHAAGLLLANLSNRSKGDSSKTIIQMPGLSGKEIWFLYHRLSEQRRVLTATRVLYPERFNGWSTIFYMLLMALYGSGHFRCSNFPPDHDYKCPRQVFQDLLCRFWLAKSPTKEESLLDDMYWLTSEAAGRRGIEPQNSVPFYNESQFLCKAYTLRINRTAGFEPLDMESASSLFEWITFCFGYHTLPVIPAVFRSSLLRISEECQDDDSVVWALSDFTVHIFGFAQCILSDETVPTYHITHIANVLLEADLVNLMGSILLLAMKAANWDLEYAFLGV